MGPLSDRAAIQFRATGRDAVTRPLFSRDVARLVACVVLLSLPFSSSAQKTRQNVVLPEKECQLKYAYLYSFGLLTTWPDSAFRSDDASFVIGVFGEKPHRKLLDRLAMARKVRGRSIQIRRFLKPGEYQDCHILYITDAVAAADRDALLAQIDGDSVLIVGETDGMERSGAVMTFYISGETVRFYLNLDGADRRKLSVNARLSKVATVIRKNANAARRPGRIVARSEALTLYGPLSANR